MSHSIFSMQTWNMKCWYESCPVPLDSYLWLRTPCHLLQSRLADKNQFWQAKQIKWWSWRAVVFLGPLEQGLSSALPAKRWLTISLINSPWVQRYRSAASVVLILHLQQQQFAILWLTTFFCASQIMSETQNTLYKMTSWLLETPLKWVIPNWIFRLANPAMESRLL